MFNLLGIVHDIFSYPNENKMNRKLLFEDNDVAAAITVFIDYFIDRYLVNVCVCVL